MEFDLGSSVAVSEQIAARRLGVSLDVLRRDRRTGKLGIPFIKLGEGKHGLVRYDLADLGRFVEGKKRVGRAAAPQPSVQASPVERPETPAVQPVEPPAHEPDLTEPTVPLMPPAPARPRTPWEALAETALAELEDDPFAAARRAGPRSAPGGYFGV
jgi:hypothetical protein